MTGFVLLAACLQGTTGALSIGILVLAVTVLLPCASLILIADWLGNRPPKAFLSACPPKSIANVSLTNQSSLLLHPTPGEIASRCEVFGIGRTT